MAMGQNPGEPRRTIPTKIDQNGWCAYPPTAKSFLEETPVGRFIWGVAPGLELGARALGYERLRSKSADRTSVKWLIPLHDFQRGFPYGITEF